MKKEIETEQKNKDQAMRAVMGTKIPIVIFVEHDRGAVEDTCSGTVP